MRGHKRITVLIGYGAFLVIVALWSTTFYQYSPYTLVSALGITNGYIVACIAAFLGGLSTFTSVPYALVVFTLGAGGLNPFLLGLVAATGLMLGDATSYALGYYGREVMSGKLQYLLNRFSAWLIEREHAWAVPVLLFLYASFFPFSNDLVVISFGLARYPFWRLMISLGLGSIVFNTLVAFIGAYSIGLF